MKFIYWTAIKIYDSFLLLNMPAYYRIAKTYCKRLGDWNVLFPDLLDRLAELVAASWRLELLTRSSHFNKPQNTGKRRVVRRQS